MIRRTIQLFFGPVIALLPILALAGLPACVSSGAGRDEAEALITERTGIRRDRPEDEETAKLRREILSRPLTADGAARLAVLNNPAVDVGFAELGVARAQLVSALRLPNPEASAAVHWHRGKPQVELGATIDITHFLRLATNQSVASRMLDAASVDAAGMAMDAALEGKRAFYAYTAARQILELRRSAAFALAQSADAAQRIFDAGNSPSVDAIAERALFEEARLKVARAEVDEVAARERLSLALGLFGEESMQTKVPERLAEPPDGELPLADAERQAVARSLDLRAWKARYAAAAGRADLASWAWFPEIRGGVTIEREDSVEGWGLGPQVGVGIPLLYQGQGESAAADSMMAAARARVRGIGISIRTNARTGSARLRNAREQAIFYRQTLLPLRQRLVDQTQLQFNAMNTGIFQLLMVKRDHIEAGRGYVESLRDYWTVRAEMEQLLAGRLVLMTGSSAGSEPIGGPSPVEH